jgi:hypothetical protein
MANQPELPVYDAGIYQLEIVDPVDGGVGAVSNQPLLSLANRTAYLKQHVDALEAGTFIPPTVSPLDSPAFTGTPTAPTPALGDNSTKVSTTAYVQGTVNGVTTKSVAGGANVTLTAIEAGRGILKFTGALTANISVIVPASTGQWTVWNATTGAFTLTIKTAAGSGVAVTQGKSVEVFSDGTNVQLQTNDFVNVALTGTPTTPTSAIGDQSTKVASTNFVYQLTNGVVTVNVAGGANVTLTPAQYGNGIILLTGLLTASIVVNLPSQGGIYVVANQTTGAFSLNLSGGAGTDALVPQGQSVVAYCDGTNVVLAGAASASSFQRYSFTATLAQKVFNAPYTPGNLMVLVNGAVQDPSDITATDGSSVTLVNYNSGGGCFAGDNVQLIAFNSFTVANALPLSGGTMVGPIQMAGGDTGVTPPQFDSSTLIPTTAFVQRAAGNYSAIVNVNATQTLPASQSGSMIYLGAPGGAYNIGLPPLATGLVFRFYNSSLAAINIVTNDGSKIFCGGINATSFALPPSGSIELFCAAGAWIVINGNGAAQIATPGYQKLPSGLIIQWGQATCAAGTTSSTTFPIAFPNACLNVMASGFNASGNTQAYVTVNGRNSTVFTWSAFFATGGSVPVLAATAASVQAWWVAIGF